MSTSRRRVPVPRAERVPLNRAKRLLRARGISQEAFADFHDCSRAWVYAVLAGMHPAPARFKADLARLLGVDEGWLFEPDDRCLACGQPLPSTAGNGATPAAEPAGVGVAS